MRLEAIRIADESDPRILLFRGVRDADLRGRDHLYCVESPRVVRRFLYALLAQRRGVLATPPITLSALLLTQECAAMLDDLLCELFSDSMDTSHAQSHVQSPVPLYIANDHVMTKLAGYRMHMGALALGTRPRSTCFESLLTALDPRDHLLITSGVVLTDNIGAIFRNAGSFGGVGILLADGSSDPLHRKVIRISSGRVFSVPWAKSTDLLGDIATLRQRHGFAVIAAEEAGGAVPLDDMMEIPALQTARRIAVVLGAEGDGVGADIRAYCDATVVIPMNLPNGLMESTDRPSLNVAVASALFLHRLSRTRGHSSSSID